MPRKSTSSGRERATRDSEDGADANARSGSRRAAPRRRRKAATSEAGFDGAESMDPEKDAAARQRVLDSDKLYYRIGEVSRLTGVKAHVLRYWETEFRWMAPPKSRSKQRLYRKRDIEFVWLLKRLLWGERYTIAGARQRIQELGVDDALALLDLPQGASPREVAGSGEAAGAEQWVSFRAALDDMHGELVKIRGALQEGA